MHVLPLSHPNTLQEFLLTFKFFISILFWCIDIHVVYVCIGMNVCTCVGACTCMCESHRPMVVGIFLYDSLAYFFEIGSLIQPGTHWSRWIGQPMSSWDSPVSASTVCSYTYPLPYLAFSGCIRNINSSCHALIADTFWLRNLSRPPPPLFKKTTQYAVHVNTDLFYLFLLLFLKFCISATVFSPPFFLFPPSPPF